MYTEIFLHKDANMHEIDLMFTYRTFDLLD